MIDSNSIPKEPVLVIGNEKIKFMYNGIKIDKKLYKGYFSFDKSKRDVTFISDGHEYLPKVIRENFKVENDTDVYTDYFDNDSFCITPDTKEYYNAALIAAAKRSLVFAKRNQQKIEKGARFYRSAQNIRIAESHIKGYLENAEIILSNLIGVVK